MTDSVAIPVTAELAVGVIRYAVQGFHARMQVNGVPVCQVILGAGRSTEDPTRTVDVAFSRGDQAQLVLSNLRDTASGDSVSYNANAYTLIDGRIDDFGPAGLSFGRAGFMVRIVGRLSDLSTGTLAANGFNPASWRTSNSIFSPYAMDTVDVDDVLSADKNFWVGLQKALLRILKQDDLPPTTEAGDTSGPKVRAPPQENLRSFLIDRFGSRVNQLAIALLAPANTVGLLPIRNALLDRPGVKGDGDAPEELGSSLIESICRNLAQVINETFSFEPVLHKLMQLGDLLRFKVIETGNDIRVVPWTPFFRTRDTTRIRASTYNSLSWKSSEYSPCMGTVLVDGTESVDTSVVVGYYAGPDDENGLGQVHVGPVPQVFAGHSWNMFLANGAAQDDFHRSIMSIIKSDDPSTPMNRLAKLMTWEMTYAGQTVTVTCPFMRSDIGLLQAVQIDGPPIPELRLSVDDAAVYGSVTAIDIQVDAAQGTASTTYTVGYARGYEHQRKLIDPMLDAREHPFFDRNYVKGRLDTPFSAVGHWGNPT